MKLIFTLIGFLLFDVSVISQKLPDSILNSGIPGPAPTVTIRSVRSADYGKPLLVIDGVVHEFDELKKLNPDDICSINILKCDKTVCCFSCYNDVIVITTRSASFRKFIIKDFLTGNSIPMATIYFTSGNDSIKAAANDSGILITDKLKAGIKYDITVSSAGYKTFSTPVSSKQQEIFLERDIKECGNVIVSQTSCPRKRISCGYSITKILTEKSLAFQDRVAIKPVYPNPVQRNTIFNLEFENTQDETMQLAIISMNGSIVSIQSKKLTKGLNRLSVTADAKWAAGIYNIQLRNEKGTLIRQEKLVVQ